MTHAGGTQSLDLQGALARMMGSGEFTDMQFICNGQQFLVHKAIVFPQSPTIKAVVTGPFKESQTATVNMDAFGPSTVKQLVQFFYTSNYESSMSADSTDGSPNMTSDDCLSQSLKSSFEATPLMEHIRVNSIGDYYQVDGLVSLANTRLKSLLQSSETDDQSWLESFTAATQEALSITENEELREILATTAASQLSQIVKPGEFLFSGVILGFPLKVLQSCEHRIQTLLEQVEVHQSQIAQKDLDILRKKKSPEETEDRLSQIRACLENLNMTLHCRNMSCDAEFCCYIDADKDRCILCCAQCKCKHQ
ncbi:BTB/POZ domain-containing protein [Aspergillus homomorphus CBS 101889]|uniref:BTB domain-containing protein n=1 Tax=Aspergillus homomorphus (strain CBS 101889) TaxID=1450537 RepID=A0A395HKB0_ASPHC|nr:hypothetical protein BO97DRAFT_462249 [Aspergillus homomorphus CBS 101889]RAL07949.1 hypothetical protein BO97DRAFT_462249 [Aspergillus homomorphus CBS 101889]